MTEPLIVVIHGFGSHRLWMALLCWRLRRRGFRVENWGYRSFFHRIETHGDRLHAELTGRLADESEIHIVAHSMGSIVTRWALTLGEIPNLNRVVLLAPPNRGILFARVATVFIGLVIRCLAQISCRDGSFVNQLPQELPVEVGVIAGMFDWLVPAARTHLQQQTDHEVIPANHNSLLASLKAGDLIVNFLRDGRFE